MDRSIRRIASFVCFSAALLAGTSFGQQGRLNNAQPGTGPSAPRGINPPGQRVVNPQLLQAPGGWQRGDQPPPRAAVQTAPQQPGLQPQVNRAAASQAPPQPLVPFRLSPEEEARLDWILAAWEKQSSTVKTYKCDFTRLEYATVFGQNPADKEKPRSIGYGVLKYSAPDKGMFRIDSIEFLNIKTGKHEKGGPESLEHWVCDGRSIYEINHKEKTRTERPLPPEMQGTAISDGPLPFVFGAKAGKLKSRYWMREIPSPNAAEEIWLQAFPRFQADAANFKFVEIIISRKDFMPKAIQMFNPAFDPARGNDSRTVFDLHKASYNRPFDNVFTDFVAPDVDFRYKKIILQPSSAEQPTAQAQPASQPSARAAQTPSGRLSR